MSENSFLEVEGALNKLLEELSEIQTASQQIASAKDSSAATVNASARIVEAANALLGATAGISRDFHQLELPNRLDRLQDGLDHLALRLSRLEEVTQKRLRIALIGVGLTLVLALASVALQFLRP